MDRSRALSKVAGGWSAVAMAPLLLALPLLAGACGGGDDTQTAAASSSAASSSASGTGGATTTSSTSTSSTSGTGGGSGGSGGVGGATPGRVVRIVAIGDTGEGNEDQNLVADRMSERCMMVGGCDAVMVNGDNFYDNGVTSTDDAQWGPKFEQPYDRPGLNGLPFYVVLGNHDYGPTSTGDKQAQIDYTSLPVGTGPGTRPSDKWTMPAAYYDVQIGDVHLFAIDTIDFLNGQQESEMSAKVATSPATWKIVFAHHPRYTSGEHYFDNQALGFAGMFDFQRAIYCGADMFMTGHDHDREIIDKGRDSSCPDTYFVISGSGAKTRETFDFTPTDPSQLFYDEMTEGFAYMEFNGPTLLFEFVDKLGTVNFSKTITK